MSFAARVARPSWAPSVGGRRTIGWARVVAVLGCVALLAGGWLLLRSSPFVSVKRVRVAGVHGVDAGAIERALASAARRMSTLDVNRGELRAAVASYPVVSEIRVKPHFPHALSIEVVEQLPVAALVVGSFRTAVAADGVVLGPDLASSSLPTVYGYRELAQGAHVSDGGLRAILTVLGAAPVPMGRAIDRVYDGAQGLTLKMKNGLLAYFGDAGRPHAKWLSLDRVLADSGSAGASYVDVRIPGRPAAGFPAGVIPPAQSTTETATSAAGTNNSEATVASIAAVLAGSNNGVSSPSSSGAASAGSSTGSSTEPSSGSSSEPSTETPTPTETPVNPAESPASGG